MCPTVTPEAEPAPGTVDDPYSCSLAVDRLRRALRRDHPPRLACMDIDSTLTGNPETANAVRTELEAQGFVVGVNTSRTEEMVMTAATYRATAAEPAFDRPPPRLGRAGDRRVAVPPETAEPRGILDGDFVAGSSGTRLLLRQRDGRFLPDLAYEGRYGLSAEAWRARTWAVLRALQGEDDAQPSPGTPAPIEDPESYRRGRTDVYPPQFRIQMDFASLEEKLRFERRLRAFALGPGSPAAVARRLRVTDDSHPRRHRWKVFVTPRGGTKAHAAEWLIGRLCALLAIERPRLEVLFTGDSFPDLEMGLLGGLGTRATFLLAGHSRLVEALCSDGTDRFAGHSLWAYRRRLHAAGPAGHYRFRVPGPFRGQRTLVVGDMVFPDTDSVETVYRYITTRPERVRSECPAQTQPSGEP